MAFYLVSYTVTAIKDDFGYMKALGATQTALVKREAEEGTSKNQSGARQKVAQYKADADIEAAKSMRASHVECNTQREEESESDRNLGMKRAEFEKEINQAQAEARLASDIATARQNQEVVREQTKQKLEKEQVMIQVTSKEVQRKQIDAEGVSASVLMRQTNEAKGVKVSAEAQADRITQIGTAEAGAVGAKGAAEATVMKQKAEAFQQYGEAAIVQSIVERMPEIASAVSAPLASCDRMVFVSQDGTSGSKLTNDVINIVASLPDAVEGLTGINLRNALGKLSADAPNAD